MNGQTTRNLPWHSLALAVKWEDQPVSMSSIMLQGEKMKFGLKSRNSENFHTKIELAQTGLWVR